MDTATTLQITTPTDREVQISRVFDAPRRLVFDALTRPELLKRWCLPNGWSMIVCDIDLKVDGAFHFVSRRPDGKEIGQRGVYREIDAPQRLVNSEWWEDWNPGESLVTTALTEADGKTTLTSTVLFPSQEVRDIVLKNGMKQGAADCYAKLAELLASAERGAPP